MSEQTEGPTYEVGIVPAVLGSVGLTATISLSAAAIAIGWLADYVGYTIKVGGDPWGLAFYSAFFSIAAVLFGVMFVLAIGIIEKITKQEQK